MCKEMFQNDRYITRGIKEKINPLHYLQLWQMIEDMDVEQKDYLQIFVLRTKFGRKGLQEVEHTQEEPPYRSIHRFYTATPVNAKIFVLDDGNNSTMLLADEY